MLGQSGSTRSIGYKIALIDVSVAPPTLITVASGTCARNASGNVTGIQSPLSITFLTLLIAASTSGRPSACSTSIPSNAGTEFHTVTPSRRYGAQSAGSPRSPAPGSTSAPPAANIPNMSYTDRSNDSD